MAVANIYSEEFTIDTSTHLSASIDIAHWTPVGMMMPAAWTAANLTFQVAYDNSDFGNMYDAAGGEVTVTADTDIYIAIDPIDFAGCQYLKVRSGTSGTPVAQAAVRTLQIILKNIS